MHQGCLQQGLRRRGCGDEAALHDVYIFSLRWGCGQEGNTLSNLALYCRHASAAGGAGALYKEGLSWRGAYRAALVGSAMDCSHKTPRRPAAAAAAAAAPQTAASALHTLL
eukprot:361077-Chlamydomonas_euryale.AAC.2